jgi:dipeptidyl aminopeptidase/acylaminoacyl peptidase
MLNAYPSSWSPDGKTLLFQRLSEKDGSCCEIWTLRIDDKGKPEEPKKFEHGGLPAFSPDGRWVAYASFESGTPQVYVVPFPGPGGKWQISADGGAEPRWSKKGHELFYATSNSALMEVPYSLEKNSFQPGKPQTLFRDQMELRAPFLSYDVAPDGDHFVVFQFPGGRMAATAEPTVVLNWLDQAVAAGQSNTSN